MDTHINSLSEIYSAIGEHDQLITLLAALSLLIAFNFRKLRFPRLKITPILIIIALALALRLSPLGTVPFSYDEIFSASMAGLPLDKLGEAVIADVHPPIYYLILSVASKTLGDTETVLRLPALALSLISVWLTYKLAWRLTKNKQVGLIAALVIAVLPAHIRYSVEARGYMLLLVLVQSALYANLTRRYILFAAATMLLPLVHSLGYFYMAALVAGDVSKRLNPLPAFIPIPGAVWLPFMLYQSADVADGFWLEPLTPSGILTPLATMTVGASNISALFIAVPGAFILTYLGINQARRIIAKYEIITLLMVAFGVPGIAALVSFAWKPIYLDRALMPAVMLFVPLWAAGIYRLQAARWIAIITLGVALAGYQTDAYALGRPDLEQWINSCRGDAIYTVSTGTALIAKHYAGDRPVYVWDRANDLGQTLPDNAKQLFGLVITDGHSLPDSFCIPYQWDNPFTTTEQNILEIKDQLQQPHDVIVIGKAAYSTLISYEVHNAN